MTDTKRSLRVVVVQGHRNTSGGDPREAQRTPAIANAIVAALQAAGHDAICLQHADGTRDDWFAGSLDGVARAVMTLHHQKPVDLMLDIHLEGDGANTPGVFAIVPDGDTLQTLTAYDGADDWASNTLDRQYAAAIARHIARETGMPIRTRNVVEPGVMSERQTHVGADLGWRLAMFGYTAPARDTMARLVIECGNIVADAARIFSEVFPAQVARGVVAAIADVAGATDAVPEPLPMIAFPPFGTIRDLRDPRTVTVTVPMLRARRWAETTQPILAEWPKGHRFAVRGWIIGERVEGNPLWWLTGAGKASDRRWRVWSGGTDCAGLAALALPVREPGTREVA
ncbi:MAG: hypothetical protein WBA46_05080 [Thermomicrobiales bacterium]